jgi:predicted transcriptional regulator
MAESTAPDRIPVTIEVTPAQKRRLEQRADETGQSLKAVVAAAIDREFSPSQSKGSEEGGAVQEGSFLDGIEHLVGSVDGPSDLSTNPKHMEGYGRS